MIEGMLVLKVIIGVIAVFILLIAIAAIELKSQPERYQSYWQDQNSREAQENEILYIALGDSTAQGIGASSAAKGYVGLIAKELAHRSGKSVRVVNVSRYGAKVKDALANQLPMLEKLPVTDKTIITIEIGANDISSFDPAKFEKEIDELMGKLPKQTVISDIPYFGGGVKRNLEPTVISANEIMHRLAKKHGFNLAKLHENTKKDDQLRDYAVDRFHPSGYNYRTAWAPAFLELLK